jgi:Ca-activated chloride channel homolog
MVRPTYGTGSRAIEHKPSGPFRDCRQPATLRCTTGCTSSSGKKATTQVRRQALVLLSDGLDTGSHLAFDDVLDFARRAAVNIYVIVLRGSLAQVLRNRKDSAILHGEYALNTVTRESGGRLFLPKTARDLSGIYTAIAQELFSQYELGYMPVRGAGDGGFRRLAVRVRSQTNILARTRSGYYASSQTTTGM